MVLGVSGSPHKNGMTAQIIQTLLNNIEDETEYVSLSGKNIGYCRACNGCIKNNTCIVQDDMKDLRALILNADGYIFGGCNYYKNVNSLMHCFFERFFQFRHRDQMLLAGKPAVIIGVGGGDGKPAIESISAFLNSNCIKIIDSISATGSFACHTCGYGETCECGGYSRTYGLDSPISKNTPCLKDQQEVLQKAVEAVNSLLTAIV